MAIGRPPEFRAFYLLDVSSLSPALDSRNASAFQFGLCRFYRHDDGRMRRPREKTGFKGTLRYAPLSCHRGEEMCRRDDLWSWLYMVIEMISGVLGWQQVLADVSPLPRVLSQSPSVVSLVQDPSHDRAGHSSGQREGASEREADLVDAGLSLGIHEDTLARGFSHFLRRSQLRADPDRVEESRRPSSTGEQGRRAARFRARRTVRSFDGVTSGFVICDSVIPGCLCNRLLPVLREKTQNTVARSKRNVSAYGHVQDFARSPSRYLLRLLDQRRRTEMTEYNLQGSIPCFF